MKPLNLLMSLMVKMMNNETEVKRKMLKKVSSLLSNLISSIAFIGVKPTCAGWIYQPKAPKHLSEK